MSLILSSSKIVQNIDQIHVIFSIIEFIYIWLSSEVLFYEMYMLFGRQCSGVSFLTPNILAGSWWTSQQYCYKKS